MIQKIKVISYIFRNNRTELLVFDHRDFPEAGTQVVGGTVEEGEDYKNALAREILEEAGVKIEPSLLFSIGESVFQRSDRQEINLRNYFGHDSIDLSNHWTHQVKSNGEDNDLFFNFYWIRIEMAKKILVGNFGEFL